MRWIVAALLLLVLQSVPALRPSPTPPAAGSVDALVSDAVSTSGKVRVEGRVVDASPTHGSGVRLAVEVETLDGETASGRLSLSMRSTSRRWRTGDRAAFSSRLRRIVGFGNFGEMDWAAYMARRGIRATAYAWSDGDVRLLVPPAAGEGLVDALRRRFAEACESVGGQGAEILEALTIGDRTWMTKRTEEVVRDAGLAHYLAISGSHMALVVALVVGLVRACAARIPWLLVRYDVLRGAAVAGAVAVVAYGFVSGGGVSVARSVLMAVAAMAALWSGRPGDDLRALGGSAIVLALAMPGVGEEAGFQLSYLAVAALILDSRRRRRIAAEAAALARAAGGPAGLVAARPGSSLRRFLPRGRAGDLADAGLHLAVETARLSLLCWVVTSPIVAQHFQRMSIVAPLANVLAAPLVSAVVVCGLVALLVLPAWPSAGLALVRLGASLSDAVLVVAEACASLPLAAVTTVAPGPVLALLLPALVLGGLAPPGRWRRAGLATGATLAFALLVHGLHSRYRSDRLDAWFASVGQGDAAFLRLPGGEVVVVDPGPPGRGRMIVGPLLRRAWVWRIDVLSVSHLQADHAGAAVELLEDFEVGEVWVPAGPCGGSTSVALLEAARARGVPVRRVWRGEVPAFARPKSGRRWSLEVLGPGSASEPCEANDQSLVLAFGFAGRRLLFTGDVEARGEAALAEAMADGRGADILKVPHHGSRTSSSEGLLDIVQPRLAVVSLGLDNRFAFPAPEVVARYARRSAALLRTDRDGAIHLTIGEDGAVDGSTFRGGELEAGALSAPAAAGPPPGSRDPGRTSR